MNHYPVNLLKCASKTKIPGHIPEMYDRAIPCDKVRNIGPGNLPPGGIWRAHLQPILQGTSASSDASDAGIPPYVFYLDSQGITHCDIKDENIVVDNNYKVRPRTLRR